MFKSFDINMFSVVIDGQQTFYRPSYISVGQWLTYWEKHIELSEINIEKLVNDGIKEEAENVERVEYAAIEDQTFRLTKEFDDRLSDLAIKIESHMDEQGFGFNLTETLIHMVHHA